jgi:hypothetical protein
MNVRLKILHPKRFSSKSLGAKAPYAQRPALQSWLQHWAGLVHGWFEAKHVAAWTASGTTIEDTIGSAIAAAAPARRINSRREILEAPGQVRALP